MCCAHLPASLYKTLPTSKEVVARHGRFAAFVEANAHEGIVYEKTKGSGRVHLAQQAGAAKQASSSTAKTPAPKPASKPAPKQELETIRRPTAAREAMAVPMQAKSTGFFPGGFGIAPSASTVAQFFRQHQQPFTSASSQMSAQFSAAHSQGAFIAPQQQPLNGDLHAHRHEKRWCLQNPS